MWVFFLFDYLSDVLNSIMTIPYKLKNCSGNKKETLADRVLCNFIYCPSGLSLALSLF